jgi:hypothetical protein
MPDIARINELECGVQACVIEQPADDARKAPPDTLMSHHCHRADILGGNVVTASATSHRTHSCDGTGGAS